MHFLAQFYPAFYTWKLNCQYKRIIIVKIVYFIVKNGILYISGDNSHNIDFTSNTVLNWGENASPINDNGDWTLSVSIVVCQLSGLLFISLGLAISTVVSEFVSC